MKYTKGGFPFKASPAKQNSGYKKNTGVDESVKATDFLKVIPNETVSSQSTKNEYNNTKNTTKVAVVNKEEKKKKNASRNKVADANYEKGLKKRTSLNNQEHKGNSDEAYEAMQNDHDTDGDGNAQTNSKNFKIKTKKTIKPSFPATPAGNKARLAAEKALEAKEDAGGK